MQRFDCIRVDPGRWEPPPCFPLRDRWGDFWAVRYCRCEFWKLHFWALRISGFQGFLKSPAKSTSFGDLSVFDMWVTRLGGVSASSADGPGALGSKRCDSNQGWACRAMYGWRHGGRCAFSAVHAFVSWTDCPSHPTPCCIQGIVFDLLLKGGSTP